MRLIGCWRRPDYNEMLLAAPYIVGAERYERGDTLHAASLLLPPHALAAACG